MENEKHPVLAFRELLDAIKTTAFQRGVENPEWVDVWITLSNKREYAQILQQKGISTSALTSDLQFITRFGTRDNPTFQFSDSKDVMKEIRDDIVNQINQKLDLLTKKMSPTTLWETEDLLNDMRQSILKVFSNSNDEHAEIKVKIANDILQRAMKFIKTKSQMESDPLGSLAPLILLKGLLIEVTGNTSVTSSDNVLQILESMGGDGRQLPPTALEVVENVMMVTADGFKNLLIRNGLLTTSEADAQDLWKDVLPCDKTASIFNKALESAHDYHSKNLEPKHLALQLLETRDVQIHLYKLGVTNQQDLRNAFEEKLFKVENDNESKVRFHAKVDDDSRNLLWSLDDILKGDDENGNKAPKALRLLMSRYPDIDKAMNEAGLRRRMLRGWNAAYDLDEDKIKGKKSEEKKKKKKDFEVSDAELEKLIQEFCVDYTKLAKENKFDPMVGNETAMEDVITILLKRGRKNPMIVGDPGVGKTKMLEGISQRIAAGNVPPKLIGARVLYLDLAGMDNQPYVGIFEKRLLTIAKGVAERNAAGRPPILLGADEFGSGMDAGGAGKRAGTSELLKPYLASGDLFVIANMTRQEWQKKGKRNGALARRFNEVSLIAPNDSETAKILLRNKGKYARHHGIRVPDALLPEIARLAGRYVPGNQPDKSIDAFDSACAKAARSGARTLDISHINAAISRASNIPAEFFNRDEKQRYASLDTDLENQVLGQKAATDAVANALKRAKAGLKNPMAPIGNFLFMGPTGVGKTELVRALARILYGGEAFINKFDMSEYMEKHSVARLIGAPPGYVGFDEGGGLINKLQTSPRAINLFDEAEKGHQNVFNALLAPFEDGIITDGQGFIGNMRECINILTCNLGAEEVQNEGARLGLDPLRDREQWNAMAAPIYMEAARRFFRPEFRNRLDGIIIFHTLDTPVIEQLVDRRLGVTESRLQTTYPDLSLQLCPDFRLAIKSQGFDPLMGARPLDRVVKEKLDTPLSDYLLRTSERTLRRAKGIFAQAAQSTVDISALMNDPWSDLRAIASLIDGQASTVQFQLT